MFPPGTIWNSSYRRCAQKHDIQRHFCEFSIKTRLSGRASYNLSNKCTELYHVKRKHFQKSPPAMHEASSFLLFIDNKCHDRSLHSGFELLLVQPYKIQCLTRVKMSTNTKSSKVGVSWSRYRVCLEFLGNVFNLRPDSPVLALKYRWMSCFRAHLR